jgi:hypothetical protein
MFLAGQTGAWYAGALPANYRSLPANYRSVVTTDVKINNQADSAQLLNAGYIDTESTYGTNDATNRFPYLVSTTNNYGSGDTLIYSAWVYLHAEYFTVTGIGERGQFNLFGRGTGDFTSSAVNGPNLFAIRMSIYGDSGQPSRVLDTTGTTSEDVKILFDVNLSGTNNQIGAAVIGGLTDSDSTNWSGQWMNITFYYSGSGVSSFVTANPIGGGSVHTFSQITRQDNAYSKIREEGFGGTTDTLNMDNQHSEHMGMVAADYATNFTASPRLGPVIITTTANTNIINPSDDSIRSVLGTYVGETHLQSAQTHLPFIGGTDALKLTNRGSFADFDDDTGGTIPSSGTF